MAIESLAGLRPLSPAPATIAYLGRLAILGAASLRAAVRPVGFGPAFVPETARQFDRLLAMGLPSVALVHVGMGSFLAMQSYFGATFVDGTGSVVGVGLIRNLAPLLTGFILAGLVAARYVGEFRGGIGPIHSGIDPATLAAPRLAAAMLAGPVLSAWGSLVGVSIGYLVAKSLMGMSFPGFFDIMLEMLWVRDVVGLVVKGAAFGLAGALLACHEGMAGTSGEADSTEAVCRSACRAAYLAGLAILAINAGWFLLVYHAGPAFGPTVLTPPNG